MADHKTILLVEDERLLSNLLRQRLEKDGFKVEAVSDGDEALKFLKTNKPDLVLLDVILPKMSGFELMEKLRDDAEFQKVPIIIMSNLGQESDVEKGQMLGAVGYFVKAKLSIEELAGKVREFLGSK